MPPKALPPPGDPQIRTLALVAQPGAVPDALYEALRAHELHASTAAALQRRINALDDLKAKRNKANGAAVRRTEDELATAVVGDQFVQLADAVKRVTTSYDVGATPGPADVKMIMAHSMESRTRFLAWQNALKTKKKDASKFKDRIDEVRSALSTLLLKGADDKAPTAQQTIPGIDTEPPEPQGWANETTKRVIIETFAHEVKRADHEAKAAADAGDAAAEKIARARAADRQRLLDDLAAAGFTAEPMRADDEVTALELDFELADEPDLADAGEDEEASDSDEPSDDEGADVVDGSTEPEPEDPTKHPALAGAIASTKAKRAAKKQTGNNDPKRGRGGKK